MKNYKKYINFLSLWTHIWTKSSKTWCSFAINCKWSIAVRHDSYNVLAIWNIVDQPERYFNYLRVIWNMYLRAIWELFETWAVVSELFGSYLNYLMYISDNYLRLTWELCSDVRVIWEPYCIRVALLWMEYSIFALITVNVCK